MAPGSATPMWRAVTVQAHQPTGSASAISRPRPSGVSHSGSTRKASQPHSVPTVPGAVGDSPLPKPRARKWAGWASRKRTPGRRGGAVSVALDIARF